MIWLLKHTDTATHKRLVQGRTSSSARLLFASTVPTVVAHSEDTAQRKTDLKLANWTACHTSILSIDHLGEVISSCAQMNCGCGKNTISNLKLHRTKCTNIIKNVLGPEFKKQLLDDIGTGAYSLIIDESTDITTYKQLCLVVRYFSKTKKQMVSTFLGMVVLEEVSANAQVSILSSYKLAIIVLNLYCCNKHLIMLMNYKLLYK